MHEVSLCQSTIEIIEQQAKKMQLTESPVFGLKSAHSLVLKRVRFASVLMSFAEVRLQKAASSTLFTSPHKHGVGIAVK